MSRQKKSLILLGFSLILFGLFEKPVLSYAESTKMNDGFDFPVGSPDGLGYGVEGYGGLAWLEEYDYTRDGVKEFHPGEDWNDDDTRRDFGSNNDDKGDPVYAIGNGVVKFAKFGGSGWGYVVLIEHSLPNGSKIWSQYAHLASIPADVLNKEGMIISRGKNIGTIGDYPNGTGRAHHLHFEIRKKYRGALEFVMNWKKSQVEEYYINPSEFINSHRPLKSDPITLNATETKYDSTKLSWNKPTFTGFDHYELYRATEKDGTIDSSKRVDLLSGKQEANNIDTTSFSDSGLNPNTDYFYTLCAFNGTGLSVCSEETTTKTTTGLQNITDNPYNQSKPNIKGRYITYFAPYSINGYTAPNLYLYDTQENKTVVQNVEITGSTFPNEPQIYEDKVVYFARNKKYANYGDMNIYYYDASKDGLAGFPITEAAGHQYYPKIYKNYVVWEDHSKMVSDKDVDIYYIDLDNGASGPQPLVTGAGLQWLPEIWEGKVSYVNGTVGMVGMDRIEIMDIATKQKIFIPGTYKNPRPTIDAGKVVWSDDATKKTYVYDITSGNLETLNIYSFRTIVRENKIVYQAYVAGSALGELHLYDLITRTDRTVVSDLAYLSYFDYYQGILVYMNRGPSDSMGSSDIFILRL